MNKTKKLLSVLLAVVMILSTMAISASAYQAYDDSQEAVYTSNDTGLAMLLTDEQRASWFCDLVNGLLASVNIKASVPIVGDIDLTSLDATCDTLSGLKNLIKTMGIGLDLGIIEKLDLSTIDGKESINNAVGMVDELVVFLDRNVGVLGDVIGSGVSFGILGGVIPVDLTKVNEILVNLDDFLKGTFYGLGARKLTGGIGDDPAWPNATLWEDMAAASKPTLDKIVKDLVVNLLTTPRHTEKITNTSQNLICTNPEAYGATAAMIHSEAALDADGKPVLNEDGQPATWYYIYGTLLADGTWKFTENSTAANGLDDKNYITHWNEDSCLLKNFDTSILDFETKTLYQMLGDALPWAYDTFGAPNLDGQLRATLMQFCGAYNELETDTAIIDQLKAKVLAYQKIEDDGAAKGRALLSDAMEAKVGEAGNYNFQYISLSGANINTMPDDLYYVVQWGNGWEFYHVDFSRMAGEKLELFKMINWEYQAPAWSEIMPTLDSTSDSYLRNITDAIGKILNKAVNNLEWAYDSASEDNAHFEANVMGLVRRVIKLAPNLIYGKNEAYKAKDIDSQSDEKVIAVLGADLMEWLMPALVMPEDVSCLEELVVYGLREFIAEILPEYSWDTQIAAASTDADYLNIALDMGASIGVYYLKNVMALGTTTNGTGTTTYTSPDSYIAPSADCATGWNTKLNYVLDNILKIWVPDLTSKIVSRNATVMNGTDALDKLSIIFNSMFPGLLSLISGCSATIGDGTNKNCTVDMKQVKNLLAGILDLKIEPIAAKLYRNSTGYGNKKLYNAVVNILIDLTTGLGFNDSPDYENLKTSLNNALNAANPLNHLITNANLKVTVKNLLWSITDNANKAMWVQDLIAILMQVTGKMDDMVLKGINQTIDQFKYVGSTTPTITTKITLDTDGLKSVWYDGGYRSGNFVQDGAYSGLLTKLEIVDLEGNVVATKNPNLTLNPNTEYTATITGKASTDAAAYTLKSYVIVTLPDGKTQANNGEPIVTTSNFITAAAATDDTVNMVTVLNKVGSQKDVTAKMWNIYVDENTPISAIEDYKMYVGTNQAQARKLWISGFGYLTLNADGSVTFQADKTNAFTWTKNVYEEGKSAVNSTITPADCATPVAGGVPAFWKWNNDYAKTEFGGNKDWSEMYNQQYAVDKVNFNRAMYSADFTTFAFTATVSIYSYVSGRKKTTTHNFTSQPSLIFYNSYGLESLIQRALNSNRVAEDYTPESWNAYIAALKAAIAEFYMAKSADTFVSDHQTNGISDFKTAGENLTKAIEGLVAVTESASTATDYTAEEKAVLNSLKATLDAQGAKKNLNNKNYIMYRWLKYYNEYAWLNGVYNNAQIPSGVANNKLIGVPSDNDKIAAAIAAAPANMQAALNALVVAPTAEESEAAAKAKANFLENLPTLDLTAIQVDMAQMAQYESRLISRTPNTYYLNDAYKMANSITDPAAYTAESWAKFNTARTEAYNVSADSTSTPAQIHEARYNLLVAYKGLIPAGKDVDLSALQAAVDEAMVIFNNQAYFEVSPAGTAAGYKTLDEALANVIKELGVKVTVVEDGKEVTYYIGGGDTAAAWLDEAGLRTAVEATETVTRVTKELKAALANIQCKVRLEEKEGDTTTVVTEPDGTTRVVSIIDGIVPGSIATMDQLLSHVQTTVTGADITTPTTLSKANAFGTGAKVEVNVNGVGTVGTYYVLIYGDVTGDGAVDGFDAIEASLAAAGSVTLDGVYATAADVNKADGVTSADYSALCGVATGLNAIDQKTGALS